MHTCHARFQFESSPAAIGKLVHPAHRRCKDCPIEDVAWSSAGQHISNAGLRSGVQHDCVEDSAARLVELHH